MLAECIFSIHSYQQIIASPCEANVKPFDIIAQVFFILDLAASMTATD